ncbi:MAG: hypothetical protein AB7G44_12760, partial [Bacteroidia bacterium]
LSANHKFCGKLRKPVRQAKAYGWSAWGLFFCYFSLGKQRKVKNNNLPPQFFSPLKMLET